MCVHFFVPSLRFTHSFSNIKSITSRPCPAHCHPHYHVAFYFFFNEPHINITHRYVNYTIFNDEEKGIQILQGFSGELERVNFHRMPDCAVEALLNYVNKKSLSDDMSKKSIDWMMNDKLTHVVCENAFFIEKYALGVLNFAAPMNRSDDLGELWIRNDERRCMCKAMHVLYYTSLSFCRRT